MKRGADWVADCGIRANAMSNQKNHGVQPGIPEEEYIESILDIMEEELASTRAIPRLGLAKSELDSLVEDLLEYLSVDSE